MNRKTLLIALGLWAIELAFVAFMVLATDVETNPLFWPLMIGMLLILLPIDYLVATRMPKGE